MTSPFIYLLNAMEAAGKTESPFEHGYGDKRRAVLDYVAKLESASKSEMNTSDTNEYFGKDRPKGMVQVEFVGVDPELKRGDYGWKPSQTAFADIYVDGHRFNVQLGDMGPYGHPGKRGFHVNYPFPAEVENRSVNALTILLPTTEEK